MIVDHGKESFAIVRCLCASRRSLVFLQVPSLLVHDPTASHSLAMVWGLIVNRRQQLVQCFASSPVFGGILFAISYAVVFRACHEAAQKHSTPRGLTCSMVQLLSLRKTQGESAKAHAQGTIVPASSPTRAGHT